MIDREPDKVRRSKLVGVTFEADDGTPRQDVIRGLETGFRLFWEHQPDNPYDENAILCYADPLKTMEAGHLNKELAADFVERANQGVDQEIYVSEVTGGQDNKSYGVNIKIHEYWPEGYEETKEEE